MKSNFSVIESKLSDFIRKFYSNRIVQGILLFIVISLVSLFTVFMIESYAFMTPNVKTILFYSLIFLFAGIFIFFILIPGGKLLKIIPFLSHQEAAKIIQNYFTDSKDLLTNVLQLHENEGSDLIVAAINQKIDSISPLNFTNAIDYRKTFRFLFVTTGLVILVLLFSSLFKSKIQEGSTRFLDYSTFYQPENPYSITILSDSLECALGDDFTLSIKISGPSILNDIFIQNEPLNVRMNHDSANCFSYTFKNITENLSFRLNYLDFVSEDYYISVYHKPSVFVSRVTIIPPSYTGIKPDEFDNAGDFSAPYGSVISWDFNLQHTDSFDFLVDSTVLKTFVSQETSQVRKFALKSFDYCYSAIGEKGVSCHSDLFHVNIMPDYSPQIMAVSAVDSTASNSMFFSGHIADDYGFHSLTFNYFDSDNPRDVHSNNIELHQNVSQDFYYYFDFSNLSKSVSYYFEVRDNDEISGYKSAKTPLSVYSTITNEEKQQRVDNLNSSIFDKIEESKRLLRDLNNELNDFQKNVSSNDQMSDYEKQLKLNNLMEKQQQLKDLFEDLSQENMSKNSFENQLSPQMSEELLEKQRLLQEMWDNILTDDIKELLDKINEMAKSMSEKSLRDNIQDLKFDFNQISEQLDRNNALMKMYNIDNNIQNLSKDLKEMSKEYEELSKEVRGDSSTISDKDKADNKKSHKDDSKDSNKHASENENTDNSSNSDKPLSDKIDDFKKEFEKKMEQYNNVLKENDELGDQKLDLNDVKKQFEELKNALDYQQNEMETLDRELGNKDKNYENTAQSDLDNRKNSDEKSHESDKSDVDDNSDMSKNDTSKPEDEQSVVTESGKKQQNQGDNNKNSRPNQSQKQRQQNLSDQMEESSEQIEELSESLKGNEKKNKQKQNQENLNDIRQILDNLVTISFNQESLLSRLKANSNNNFLATDVLLSQNSIAKDFSLVQDSIYALAKREPKLGHAVYDKIDNIHTYFNKTVNSINEGRRGETMNNQQVLLTNLNDLSLIFDEIQNQMQNQDQQQGQESDAEQEQVQSKNKKEMQQRQKSTQQMKTQQQMLKQNLQKMLEQLQQGDNPGAQQLAESLRQQEMMMQKLQEMKNGKGVSSQEQKLMNQMQQLMEENKRDIVNKNITQRMIDRQNTLFNKLLELEKAEKSQDFEEKRESKQGSDIQQNNIDDLNLKLKDFGVKEYIHTSPVNLNLFYQNLYNDYIQNIE